MVKTNSKSFRDFQMKVDSFEDQIEELIEGIDLTSDKVKDLNFDFANLIRELKEVKHSDDDYNIGESIMDHMKMDLQNVNDLTQGWDKQKRNILRLLSFLHDIAKPETFEMRGDKATFYGHPDRGYEVSKVILDQFTEETEEMREYVAKLVKYHHHIYQLAHSKKQLKDPNQLSYLKKFIQEGAETLQDLALFAKADSMTPQGLAEVKESIKIITEDIKRYREQEKRENEKERKMEQLADERVRDERKVRSILEENSSLSAEGVQAVLDLIPKVSDINRYLGKNKEYNAIKALQSYLQGKSNVAQVVALRTLYGR